MPPSARLHLCRCAFGTVDGTGATEGKIASLITVVNQSGRPELAAGELHRYLSEAVWLPTVLLPGQSIAWEAIDYNTARARLSHAGISVSLEFQFNEDGEIVRAYTPQRYREIKGAYVPTAWACGYRNYAKVDGIMVPMEGESEWILPEGRLPYARVRILGIK
jgi:hypothetical protein